MQTIALLVEDNLPDAVYVEELLASSINRIIHAASVAEAKNLLEDETVDVILLDLSLPDASGIDTFMAIFELKPAVPIVVLTGLEDEDVSMQAVKNGAQDYILKKDLSEHSLVKAIRFAIERKQSQEHAKRLALFEEREEFMATLTHDLKVPLIAGNRILELFATGLTGSITASQSKVLLQLRDSNKTLLSMIQNVIDVYRFEKDMHTVVLENADLLKIVEVCFDDIAPIAKDREIKLTKEVVESAHVQADTLALRRVVQNLLENAVKFTPSGGKVTARIRTDNGSVVMEVTDNGRGISAHDQAKLFQRFGRVGNRYTPGTGLGLYLCKQIIDAHHGLISCSSTEGVGTTFTVVLPAIQ